MKPQTKRRTWLERLICKRGFISNPFISNSAQPQPLLLPSFLCQNVHCDGFFFDRHPDCVTIKSYRSSLLNLVFEKNCKNVGRQIFGQNKNSFSMVF